LACALLVGGVGAGWWRWHLVGIPLGGALRVRVLVRGLVSQRYLYGRRRPDGLARVPWVGCGQAACAGFRRHGRVRGWPSCWPAAAAAQLLSGGFSTHQPAASQLLPSCVLTAAASLILPQVTPAHAVLGGQVVGTHGAATAVGVQLGLHAPLLNLLQGREGMVQGERGRQGGRQMRGGVRTVQCGAASAGATGRLQ